MHGAIRDISIKRDSGMKLNKAIMFLLISSSSVVVHAGEKRYEYCGGRTGPQNYVVSSVYQIDWTLSRTTNGASNSFNRYLDARYGGYARSGVVCMHFSSYQEALDNRNDYAAQEGRNSSVGFVSWSYSGD